MKLLKAANVVTAFSILLEAYGRFALRPRFFLNPAPAEMPLFFLIAVVWLAIFALLIAGVAQMLRAQHYTKSARNQLLLFAALLAVFMAVAFA